MNTLFKNIEIYGTEIKDGRIFRHFPGEWQT